MLNFVFYSQPYNDLSVNLTRKPKLQNATAEFMKFFLRGAFSMSIDGAPPWLRHGRGTRKYLGAICSVKMPLQARGRPLF